MKPKIREIKIKKSIHFHIHVFRQINLSKKQTSKKHLQMVSDSTIIFHAVDVSSTQMFRNNFFKMALHILYDI